MNLKPDPSSTPTDHRKAWTEITKNVWKLLQNNDHNKLVQCFDEWEELFKSYKSLHSFPQWEFEISQLRNYSSIKNRSTCFGKQKNIKFILEGSKLEVIREIELAVLMVEDQFNQGHVGHLQLNFIKNGTGEIYPCPLAHPFLNIHQTFEPTIVNVKKYWCKIHNECEKYDLRWKIILPSSRDIHLIRGESLGGAFALGLLAFTKKYHKPLKRFAISAKLDSKGTFEPVDIEEKINDKLFTIVDKVILADGQDLSNINFMKEMFHTVNSPQEAFVIIKSNKKLQFIYLSVAIFIFAMILFNIDLQPTHVELEHTQPHHLNSKIKEVSQKTEPVKMNLKYTKDSGLNSEWLDATPQKTMLYTDDVCQLHLHLLEEFRIIIIEVTKDKNNDLNFEKVFPNEYADFHNPLSRGSYVLPSKKVTLLLRDGREFEKFYVFYQREPFRKTFADLCKSIENLDEHENLKIFSYPKTYVERDK
ncbi:hypothetical protein [Candidatus Uabimicrobium amorphum]|uniref:Uncharacterized protein n=1 Tax=Uabimicrobium amorphum TaxID=2596890 RepID=A0A5S9IS75_UABAM|nr:hypothetical protein [Candidatus Uabimicrobium amorphum]BBM87139.1 hypothetical protein UABAM_05542 [Candidatus Uabimicrobium amorphum]